MPRRWSDRWLPWVGALLMGMGSLQATLAASAADRPDLRAMGTGLLIAAGGIGLAARGSHGGRRWLIIVVSLACGALLARWLLQV